MQRKWLVKHSYHLHLVKIVLLAIVFIWQWQKGIQLRWKLVGDITVFISCVFWYTSEKYIHSRFIMNGPETKVQIYRPGRRIGWGLPLWREMFTTLFKHWGLAARLFKRDFIARYRQSVLGYLWAVILPLGTVAVFVFLSRVRILNVGAVAVPYPAYALLGLTIWQLFAGGVVACTGAIVSAGSMVTKVNFPREILVIVAYGHVVFDMLVRLALVAVVFALYRVVPSWQALFLPLALLPLLLLGLGLGLMLSLLNALIRDIGNAVGLATMFLFFVTPVVYEAQQGVFRTISRYNPLAGIVTGARDLVIHGYMNDPIHFLWAGVFSTAVFLISWRIFHLAEMRVAQCMGAN